MLVGLAATAGAEALAISGVDTDDGTACGTGGAAGFLARRRASQRAGHDGARDTRGRRAALECRRRSDGQARDNADLSAFKLAVGVGMDRDLPSGGRRFDRRLLAEEQSVPARPAIQRVDALRQRALCIGGNDLRDRFDSR